MQSRSKGTTLETNHNTFKINICLHILFLFAILYSLHVEFSFSTTHGSPINQIKTHDFSHCLRPHIWSVSITHPVRLPSKYIPNSVTYHNFNCYQAFWNDNYRSLVFITIVFSLVFLLLSLSSSHLLATCKVII